jgi:hypothetical protein
MATDFRSLVLLTAYRALLGHIWPQTCAVALDVLWDARLRRPELDLLEVHFYVWFDGPVPRGFSNEFDAGVMSVVIDECFDYGQRGYAAFTFRRIKPGTTIDIRGELLFLRAGVRWRTA